MWIGLLALAHAVCGDGVVDGVEQCDDFNVAADDGCSETCQIEAFWECESPDEAFLESVRWDGRANCATSPVVDLDGIGVRVDLPDWPVFAVSPTGLDCVSAWSSGDSGRWFWSTHWQLGAYANGNGGVLSSARYSLAACKAASESAVQVIRPGGEQALFLGMRDNPCYDNRGTVALEVAAISDCEYVGDPDEDGLRNDVDDCPTVYLQLPEPFAFNNACVSEAASWTDATAGAWSKVHRDALVDGVVIGRRAVIHRAATVGPDSVVMRLAEVGPSAALGAGTVLAANVSVGANVTGLAGQANDNLLVSHGARIGDASRLGANVVVGPRSAVGPEVTLGSGVVLARSVAIGAGSELGEGTVAAPQANVGEGVVLGQGTRLRSGAIVADGATLGERCVVGRDSFVGAGAMLGDDVVVRRGAVVPPGAVIASGTVVTP